MSKRGAVLSMLIAGLCLASAVAEPEVAEELAPVEQLKADMKRVRGMLRNAEAKFRNGVTGGISTGDEVGGSPTPGKTCCSDNLKRLDKLIKSMKGSLGALERCLNGADVGALDLVQKDFQSLQRAVQLFGNVQEAVQTKQALNGCTRAYLLLEESLGQLPDCVPQPGVPGDAQ